MRAGPVHKSIASSAAVHPHTPSTRGRSRRYRLEQKAKAEEREERRKQKAAEERQRKQEAEERRRKLKALS